MAGAKGFGSDFASGHDRWLALQQVSQKILSRAGTLNTMEDRELERVTRQLKFKENLKQSQYDITEKQLKSNLKDHFLYNTALQESVRAKNKSRKRQAFLPSIPPTAEMRPFGRYSGRTHSRMTSAMNRLDHKFSHKEEEKTAKLVVECRTESDVNINRSLTTEQILTAKDMPLSERLTFESVTRFRELIGKAKAQAVLDRLRKRIAERKEREKGMKVLKKSKGLFQTETTHFT
ncbi:uncharacterized protein LOC129275675 [Lytechinus pictus]|uniref:uncharacterized protein LOC129275675 n=1 Tax=Lytechinus pictus TaxID=7653 RepID=UPI00240D04BF|nr:uncharacterized protein LOC129275675 [Lytechinus pictus]